MYWRFFQMKSVSSWREILFRFMCYFSRDSLAWLLSLWPSPDPSKCWRAQGSSLNFLSSLLTLFPGVISTQSRSLTLTHWWFQNLYLQRSPAVSIQVSPWSFRLNVQLNLNVSKLVVWTSTPSAPFPNPCPHSLPQISVSSNPVFPGTQIINFGIIWNPFFIFTPVQSVSKLC